MSRNRGVESLAAMISASLEKYSSDVAENMKAEAKAIAKDAVKELKSTSPVGSGAGGHYKDGWTSKVEAENSVSIGIRVYNKKKPWLTHLLEKGHAKRGGGRVEGIPHITPAEQHAMEEYERRLRERLSR